MLKLKAIRLGLRILRGCNVSNLNLFQVYKIKNLDIHDNITTISADVNNINYIIPIKYKQNITCCIYDDKNLDFMYITRNDFENNLKKGNIEEYNSNDSLQAKLILLNEEDYNLIEKILFELENSI